MAHSFIDADEPRGFFLYYMDMKAMTLRSPASELINTCKKLVRHADSSLCDYDYASSEEKCRVRCSLCDLRRRTRVRFYKTRNVIRGPSLAFRTAPPILAVIWVTQCCDRRVASVHRQSFRDGRELGLKRILLTVRALAGVAE